MSKTITRRGVLAGTVVAILVIAGGYVAAATLEGITTTQVGQNGGTFTGPTTTIFATNSGTTVTIQLVQATSSDDCDPAAVTWTSGTPTANVYVSGTVACTPSALQWFEELTWNGVAVPAGAAQSDTIFIEVYDGTSYAYPQFTISDTGNVDMFTGTLNVYLAAGLVTGVTLPDAYSSISIAVSGT